MTRVHPYKDHTEWLRLVDGNILQIALFYEYTTIDLRVEYYAQTLSEYLWCNYRQSNIRGYIAGYFCDMLGRYKLGDPEMCRVAGTERGMRYLYTLTASKIHLLLERDFVVV